MFQLSTNLTPSITLTKNLISLLCLDFKWYLCLGCPVHIQMAFENQTFQQPDPFWLVWYSDDVCISPQSNCWIYFILFFCPGQFQLLPEGLCPGVHHLHLQNLDRTDGNWRTTVSQRGRVLLPRLLQVIQSLSKQTFFNCCNQSLKSPLPPPLPKIIEWTVLKLSEFLLLLLLQKFRAPFIIF
jgi:hypothetical protein